MTEMRSANRSFLHVSRTSSCCSSSNIWSGRATASPNIPFLCQETVGCLHSVRTVDNGEQEAAGAGIKNWQGKNKLCLVGDMLCLQLAADSIAEESAERTGEGPLLYKACGPPSHNKPFVAAPLKEKSAPANTVGRIQSIHRASHWERTQDTAAPNTPAKKRLCQGVTWFRCVAWWLPMGGRRGQK